MMNLRNPYQHPLHPEELEFSEIIDALEVNDRSVQRVTLEYEYVHSNFYDLRADVWDICESLLNRSAEHGMNVYFLDKDNYVGVGFKLFQHNEYHIYMIDNGLAYFTLLSTHELMHLMSGECAISKPIDYGSADAKKLSTVVRNFYNYVDAILEQSRISYKFPMVKSCDVVSRCGNNSEIDSRYAEGGDEEFPLCLAGYHSYMCDVKRGLDQHLSPDNPVLKVRTGYQRRDISDAYPILYNRNAIEYEKHVINKESIPRRLTLPGLVLKWLVEVGYVTMLGDGAGCKVGHTTLSYYIALGEDGTRYAVIVISYLNHLDESALTKFVYEMTNELRFLTAHGPTNFNCDILDVIATMDSSLYAVILSEIFAQNAKCSETRVDYRSLTKTAHHALNNVISNEMRYTLSNIMATSMLLACETSHKLLFDLNATNSLCRILSRRFWLLGIPICVRNSRVKGTRYVHMSNKVKCLQTINNNALMPKPCYIYDGMQILPCGFVTTMINPCIHWHICA